MYLKTDPKIWRRLGDMKMACEMSTQLGKKHQIDIIGDYSCMTEEEKENLRKSLNATNLIDMAPFAHNGRYIAKMFEHLRDNHIAEKYDIIHIHTSKLNIMSAAMKYFDEQQPIVVSFHSPPESMEMMRFYRDDMIKFCKVPHHAFVCNSQTHRLRCLDVLKVTEDEVPSLTYAYNGVRDIYELTDIPHEKREYAGGAISRINSIKSAYETIIFLHKLAEKTGKKCFFIGSVAEYERSAAGQEYYQKCLPLLEESDKIEWIESMSPEDISEIYKNTDVNVFFGRLETFGLPILEAGLVGIPSLVLDVNGPSEIVEDGKNGYKHKVDKPIRWKKIYEECLNSYDLSLDLNPEDVRQYIMDKFSADNLGKSIQYIYDNVKE